jgi:hypothetical protein
VWRTRRLGLWLRLPVIRVLEDGADRGGPRGSVLRCGDGGPGRTVIGVLGAFCLDGSGQGPSAYGLDGGTESEGEPDLCRLICRVGNP